MPTLVLLAACGNSGPEQPREARTTNATLVLSDAKPASSANSAPDAKAPSIENADFEKAREASLRGDVITVRILLERKVRSGLASREEALLVRQSCKMMGDRECVADVRAKYPD